MQQLGDESRHDGRPAEPLGASGGAVVKHLRPRKDALSGPLYLSGRPLSSQSHRPELIRSETDTHQVVFEVDRAARAAWPPAL